MQKCTKSSRFLVVDKFVLDIQFFKQGEKIRDQSYENTPSLMSLSRLKVIEIQLLKGDPHLGGEREGKIFIIFQISCEILSVYMFSLLHQVRGARRCGSQTYFVFNIEQIKPLCFVRNCSNVYSAEIRKETNSITHLISIISTVFITLLHSRTVRNAE